jgi:hypothetical protein
VCCPDVRLKLEQEQRMKPNSNPPHSPFFKGGILPKGLIKPLFEKEGQGEIY